jgi:hypothetical protein
MYWTAKRLKELKARGYRLRYMTLEEANAEATSDKLQAPEATSGKPQATSGKQQATSDSEDTSHKQQAPRHKHQDT